MQNDIYPYVLYLKVYFSHVLFHSAFRTLHMMRTISGKKERLSRLSSVMSNVLIRFSLSCNGSVTIDQSNELPLWLQPCLMARGAAVELSFYVMIFEWQDSERWFKSQITPWKPFCNLGITSAAHTHWSENTNCMTLKGTWTICI